MTLNTKAFGNIDVDESRIINFEKGLMGFPEDKRFIILNENNNDDESVFFWLQSVDNSETAFAILNTFAVLKNYKPSIDKGELGTLEGAKEEDLLIYNIVRIPEKAEEITVNLKGPIVIDVANKKGNQVIASNDEYTVRHYIIDELKNK